MPPPQGVSLTFRMLKVQFLGNFGGAIGGSGIVGRLVVDQPFGLVLPSLHELLGLAIVGDGPAQKSGLLGRYHAMDELARFHVSPFAIRAVACVGVLGAAAAWFAAYFHASQQRA